MRHNSAVVGRAELKLAEAARAFWYDFRGKVVLDIGSSTGGFTEYALKMGAKKVYAVEKGTNQMAKPLRYDARIVLMEKTDIFEVSIVGKGGKYILDEELDTILADVSFVSLTKVLKYAKKYLVSPQTDFLVMLKPQFEAFPEQLVKGVVKNERIRREIIKDFEHWLGKNNFVILQKRDNEIVGKRGGNRERFYWLRCGRC